MVTRAAPFRAFRRTPAEALMMGWAKLSPRSMLERAVRRSRSCRKTFAPRRRYLVQRLISAAAAISSPVHRLRRRLSQRRPTASSRYTGDHPATAPASSLVAAVGTSFSMCGRRNRLGPNFIDNHTADARGADHSLNYAVLRGLDRAVETSITRAPSACAGSERCAEIQAALPQDRESLTMKRNAGRAGPIRPQGLGSDHRGGAEVADERAPGHLAAS